MAEYGHLTDDALAAELTAMKSRRGESSQALQRAAAALESEVNRRARAGAEAAREASRARMAGYAEQYRGLPARVEGEVMQWQPPPHPRPERAMAAEVSPQLHNFWNLDLWNREHVSTPQMWRRDSRAAELARRLQAERAAVAGDPERLAAFDSTLPGVDLLDTSAKDTWRPGWEQWGALHQGLSIPSNLGGYVSGLALQAGGAGLSAAGMPNKSQDEQNQLAWQTWHAGDDLTGNLLSGLYSLAGGSKDYAPAPQKRYWDVVRQYQDKPLSVIRPRDIQPSPHLLSHDIGRSAADYTADTLKGSGLSPQASAALEFAAAWGAGAGTDLFMPHYDAAPSLLAAARMFGKDAAFAGGLLGASSVAASGLMDRKDMDQQQVEAFYDDLLRSLQAQNRITD